MENQIVPSNQTIATSDARIEAMLSTALANNVPIETIERIMQLRKDLKAEAAKEAFDEALANFQAECPVIVKDKAVEFNGRRQYSYAPIESIIRQVKELLGKHGFSYAFKTEETPSGIKATCLLTHKQGYTASSDFTADMKGTNMMSNAQVTSSKATYAKRNAFCNVLGVTTGDEDTDASRTREETKAENLATKEQKEEIDRLSVQANLTKAYVVKRIREIYNVSYVDITYTQALGVIDMLNKKINGTA